MAILNATGWNPLRRWILEQKVRRGVPIICAQEHWLRGRWAEDVAAGMLKLGWKLHVVGAADGPSGGASAGVLVAAPSCVGTSRPDGQGAWGISPAGCAGRLALALIDTSSVGTLAVFSCYMWTGEGMTARNLSIMATMRDWVARLRLPWIAGGTGSSRRTPSCRGRGCRAGKTRR